MTLSFFGTSVSTQTRKKRKKGSKTKTTLEDDVDESEIALMSIHDLRTEIRDTKNELDLLSISVDSIQQRAEKLFKLHQFELEKYYTQALRQSARIFLVGIFSILVGFAIIALTFYLVGFRFGDQATQARIIIASVGAVGTVLANFIGAVYVKMFSETLKSLTEFHNRLVLTHHLHFGNFLSAKISEEKKRDETLAKMASALAQAALSSQGPHADAGVGERDGQG